MVVASRLAQKRAIAQRSEEKNTQVSKPSYYAPKGGLPSQNALMDTRAVFTQAYAVIPASTMTDIVTSNLPFWEKTRLWVLSRPLSGFAETFSQYIMEVGPRGGSQRPETASGIEAILFVVEGELTLALDGNRHIMKPGGYAFIPPASTWSVKNKSDKPVKFHWVRKKYEAVDGIEMPPAFVTNEQKVAPRPMPDTDGKWATTRFVDPDDVRHDMHVNIVTFEPGGVIPFSETHVMEHGLYVLEGKATYKLNQDWVEVEAGDYMWLRAFCPQACYAGGQGKFRYLLYKDVNRHAKLGSFVR
ncbi:MAG: (S)-ureidoglycine aminohydrolase [Cohaesibacteraceae bacterium]|nr:(S)-ureidoglycine aminohydrolase [Cohaesibacteraceae bacterium]